VPKHDTAPLTVPEGFDNTMKPCDLSLVRRAFGLDKGVGVGAGPFLERLATAGMPWHVRTEANQR